MFGNRSFNSLCGCYYAVRSDYGPPRKEHLPLVELDSHTTILSTTSSTKLRQKFTNISNQQREIQYTFPLYDGVSVVDFRCTVKDKVLIGVVKEKQQARADYQAAVDQGKAAGLLEQLTEASDVFTTKIGNVPPGENVVVELVYLGELKHDAEADGSRFQIPTVIAPRYGQVSMDSAETVSASQVNDSHGIKIVVDVQLDEGTIIRGLQSPSHPTAITMGRTTRMPEDAFDNHHASASLSLGSTVLDKDFVIIVLSKEVSTPRAILECHPDFPNQRALMATLVPKFNLPNHHPEIVFVVDRSGSMGGKIPLLVSAMKVFLKSLPTGTQFNICSFGSRHSFLFKQSKTYDQSSLKEAMHHVSGFAADFGGTEMYPALEATFKQRYTDMPLEIMLLTDGEIWNQDALFELVEKSAKKNARVFSLGIGSGASSSLVEGVARAGKGFAQFVDDGEKFEKRLVRMLRAALIPHINDYRLEVRYGKDDDDDFEIVESFEKSVNIPHVKPDLPPPYKPTISLFDTSAETDSRSDSKADRYDSLPSLRIPNILQAPHNVPQLYPYNRSTVYLLFGPDSCPQEPKSVVLRGTCEHGPLELEIPVQNIGVGKTVHQLAAKKAVHELEQGRGWITEANQDGVLLKDKYPGRWNLIVEREAIRLGTQFHVGGKWCSFIAVEEDKKDVDHLEAGVELSSARAEPTHYIQMSYPTGPGRGASRSMKYGAISSVSLRADAKAVPSVLHRQVMWSGSRDADATADGNESESDTYLEDTKQSSSPFSLAGKSDRLSSNFAQGMKAFRARSLFGTPRQNSPAASGTSSQAPSILASMGRTQQQPAPPPPPPPPPQQSGFAKRHAYGPPGAASFSAALAPPSGLQFASLKPTEARDEPLVGVDKVYRLIELQEFDGRWSDAKVVSELLGIGSPPDSAGVQRFKAVISDKGGENLGNDQVLEVWATIAAVDWLKKKMPDEEDMWEMVVDKAVAWLKSLVPDQERWNEIYTL